MKFRLLRKVDIIVIVLVAVVALAFMLFKDDSSQNLVAEITVNGEVYQYVNLSEIDDKLEIRPNTTPQVLIVAEKGKIYFEKSDCPDKICVNSGYLSHKGDTAVCLPAKTVISIVGSDLDAITY